MNVSVLIPTHNHKCYALVSALQRQLEKAGCAYEILVAEDGSRDQVSIIANHLINELSNCRHIIRRENVGRAAIRNYLASQAKGEWLMFMDSDGQILSDDFVAKYIAAAMEGNNVICGGITHPDVCHNPEKSLRWRYERNYERKHGNISNCFRSFCFMIKKEVFDCIRFDERYRKYGWEDVQFGLDLSTHGYSICNIANPLMNSDIETNENFLAKTEESLISLREHADELRQEVLLLRYAETVSNRHLAPFVRCLFTITKPMIKRNLLSATPCLKLFAFYKLGYYLSLK